MQQAQQAMPNNNALMNQQLLQALSGNAATQNASLGNGTPAGDGVPPGTPVQTGTPVGQTPQGISPQAYGAMFGMPAGAYSAGF